MINFILMDGYGAFVWSSFLFTLISFAYLYFITQSQYVREKNKFISKFGTLNPERASFAKSQSINREILSKISSI